jgi:hypothetical protein
MAACIPTMQPLVDQCFGHRKTAGDSWGLRGKNGDSESQAVPGEVIESELSPTRHRPVRDPNGLSFLNSTVNATKLDRSRAESEETIMGARPESKEKSEANASVNRDNGDADRITRTDDFSVSYAEKNSAPPSEQDKWKRGF